MHVAEAPAWVYREIFGIGAVLGLGSLILTFFVRESDSCSPKTTVPTSQFPALDVVSASSPPAWKNWFHLPGSYWTVLGVLILFSLANSTDTFLLLRARDLGYSPWAVVLVYAIYNVTYALLSFPMGVLSDKQGRWRIIAIGWAIYAGVYAGFALLPAAQAWGIWPLMALYGVYMALTDGVGKALISDHAPGSPGAAMGIFYALTGLTALAASLFAGLLWDHSGPTAAFMLGAGFAILALSAIVLMRRRLM